MGIQVMKELVSIVLPVFNSEKYVEKAIISCIDQTYSEIEIIVVDGNSTDGTLNILKKFSDRVTILTETEKGIGIAINKGIRSMKGRWFKIMNADDVLYPECIEILVSEAHKLKKENVIIHSNFDLIDSDGNIVGEGSKPNLNNLSNFEQGVVLLDRNIINNVTTLFPANTFEKYGYYNESLEFAEDYELFLRLVVQFGFELYLVEKKLVKYRMHEQQNTEKQWNENPFLGIKLRKSVLLKLNPSTRSRYKKEVKKYKNQNKVSLPISKTMKLKLKKLIYQTLPLSTANKILRTYRYKKNGKNNYE